MTDRPLRDQIANAITYHPGNRTGTPEQRHPASLTLADAVLPVVEAALAQQAADIDADIITPERALHEQALGLLSDASSHLRTQCLAGRHDNWGAGFACAACELAHRIDAVIDPDEHDTPSPEGPTSR